MYIFDHILLKMARATAHLIKKKKKQNKKQNPFLAKLHCFYKPQDPLQDYLE